MNLNYQKTIYLSLLLLVLAGVVTFLAINQKSVNPQPKLTSPSENQNHTLSYKTQGYVFTLAERGHIEILAVGPNERGETIDYRCGVDIPQPPTGRTFENGRPREATELEYLFGLARSDKFIQAQKEYLPKKGSVAYYGHDSRTTITLKDNQGKVIQSVIYSDKPEIQPPSELEELGKRISNFVRNEPQQSAIVAKCGSIPRIVIGID